MTLVAAVVAAGGLAATGKGSAVTTVKAVSKPPTMQVNRYIQDGLRWNKDSYTVRSGGTVHVVNGGSEGPHTFTVLAKKDVPKTARRQLQGLQRADEGPRRGSGQRSAADIPVPRERRRPGDAAEPRPPGRLRDHRQGKKGESIDFNVTAKAARRSTSSA